MHIKLGQLLLLCLLRTSANGRQNHFLTKTSITLKIIAESINIAIDKTSGATAVIENTAGQGTNLGFRFEQIKKIIELVENKSRIGVCIDTCHAFAAGYELDTLEGYSQTWKNFDDIIGFRFLKGMHINDSKKPFNSHVDRHESLGKGTIGHHLFEWIMNDPRLDNIPLILETPNSNNWNKEITLLKNAIAR